MITNTIELLESDLERLDFYIEDAKHTKYMDSKDDLIRWAILKVDVLRAIRILKEHLK